jgi:GntR family transcriptional regulator/MocR family aminotransferase
MAKKSLELSFAGIKINKDSVTPLYIQVYEQFRQMILARRLRPGDRLPATRNLATDLGVSRTIITQGFEQLILEGYLIGKTGSGTFVASVLPDSLISAVTIEKRHETLKNGKPLNPAKNIIPEELLRRNSDKEDVWPFQTGHAALDLFSYSSWCEVSKKVFKNLRQYPLGYEDAVGYEPLRNEIAKYLRTSRGVKCEAEQIVIVNGSQQGLNLIVESLLKKGDSIWLEDPGYHGMKFVCMNRDVKICPVPVEKDGINVNFGIDKFPGAKLAYITPSHQFPLGVTLSLKKRLQLLEWASKNNMWILEDDYDSEFRYEGRPLASLQGLDNSGTVIYSGTFSKVLFPGLRLAYLVLPTIEMVYELKKMKGMMDRQSPILDQIILSKFMEEGHFLRHIRKMRLIYSERRKILVNLIEENLGDYLSIEPSSAGMNLTAWISERIDVRKLKEEIIKGNLIVPFINEYSIENFIKPAISLGFTGFTKYKLKTGVQKLATCFENSLVAEYSTNFYQTEEVCKNEI